MTQHTRSFLEVFRLRQLLIPLSTVGFVYPQGDRAYRYLDVYVFGFRIARFQRL